MDKDAIKYLFESFGSNMGFQIMENEVSIFPCVKNFVPFKILYPLECAISGDGSKMTVLEPGIYESIFTGVSNSTNVVCLKRLDGKEPRVVNVFVEWKGGRMINWRGIVPAGKF